MPRGVEAQVCVEVPQTDAPAEPDVPKADAPQADVSLAGPDVP